MRIAVCEIESDAMERLQLFLEQYARTNPTEIYEVDFYETPRRLLQVTAKKMFYETYILTMNMPETNGIELARIIIDALGFTPVIIYHTAFKDYAMQAFEVHAVRYLMKPVSETALFEALNFAHQELAVHRLSVSVETSREVLELDCRQIEYIESVNRRMVIGLQNDGQVETKVMRESFDRMIRPLLEQPQFLRIHQSVLVNTSCILGKEENFVVMRSGKRFPVSKKYHSGVKKTAVRSFDKILRKTW